MTGQNDSNDFINAIEESRGKSTQRGVPPLHPKEGDKWVDLSEEEPVPGLTTPNLLQFPPYEHKAHIKRFCVGIPAHIEEYERIQNNCLRGKGWVLAREEWTTDKEGETFIVIKWLEPTNDEEKTKNKNKKKR